MLRLRTLGRLELESPPRADAGTALHGPKRAGLLVYLALAHPPGPKRRDTLLALFWPELDQPRARHALRNTLHSLRGSLGTDLIHIAGADEVGIPPGARWCDAAAFDQALAQGRVEEAVALYGGEFLAGFFLPDAPDFEQWVEGERQRLRRAHAGALGRLAEAAEGRGEWAAAVEHWRRVVEGEPYGGRPTLRLMAALEAAGDRAGALQLARRHGRLLQEEFGAEPDAEVLVLAERLRTEPAVSGLIRPMRRPEAGAGDAGAAPAPNVPVVGRRVRLRPVWAATLAAAVLLGVAVVGWLRPSAPILDPHRVVVAPFENRTGDPSLDPAGGMAADWIIQGLSQTALVDVITASATLVSAQRVRAAAAARAGVDPIRALAEETGAGLVVSGAYYRHGDSLRFQARITDARRGTLLRALDPISAGVASPLDAIELLRRRMLATLAPLLDSRLGAHAQVAGQPPSYEAYREYAEGMEVFIERDWAGTIEHFARATALDSSYLPPRLIGAIAHLNLGHRAQADSIARILHRSRERLAPYDRAVLDMMMSSFEGNPAASYAAARRAAMIAPGSLPHVTWGAAAARLGRPREAIEILSGIDPTRGEVRGWGLYWLALANAHHDLGSHRRELKEARRARTLHPDDPSHLWLEARALAALGRVRDVERAVSLRLSMPDRPESPDPGRFMVLLGQELRAHGRPAAAGAMFDRAVTWYRSRPVGELLHHRPGLAAAYYEAGRDVEAAALYAELAAEEPDEVTYQGALGDLAARRGDRAEAERIAAWLAVDEGPYPHETRALWLACIAAHLGRKAEALTHLREPRGWESWYYLTLHLSRAFDPLREDPAFRELLRPRE